VSDPAQSLGSSAVTLTPSSCRHTSRCRDRDGRRGLTKSDTHFEVRELATCKLLPLLLLLGGILLRSPGKNLSQQSRGAISPQRGRGQSGQRCDIQKMRLAGITRRWRGRAVQRCWGESGRNPTCGLTWTGISSVCALFCPVNCLKSFISPRASPR